MDELAFPSSSPPERRQGSASPTSLRFSRAEGRVRPRVRGEEETAPSSPGLTRWGGGGGREGGFVPTHGGARKDVSPDGTKMSL